MWAELSNTLQILGAERHDRHFNPVKSNSIQSKITGTFLVPATVLDGGNTELRSNEYDSFYAPVCVMCTYSLFNDLFDDCLD